MISRSRPRNERSTRTGATGIGSRLRSTRSALVFVSRLACSAAPISTSQSRADRTERQALKFAVLQLQHVQANLAGAILNGVDLRRNSRYRGGYDFGRYGAYYA